MSSDASYGAWTAEDLRAAVAGDAGSNGTGMGLPSPLRFAQNVADTVRVRAVADGASGDPNAPSYFLLYPSHVEGATRLRLIKSGLHPTAGRIWFVNEAASSGQWLDVEDWTDEEVIDYVRDELGLGSVPAVMYDPRSNPTKLHLFENGFSGDYESADLDGGTFSVDDVYAAIDALHKEALVTPDAREGVAPLWEDRDKGWPIKDAEKTVQHYLRVGLSTALFPRKVRAEGTTPGGRFDLLIEELNPTVPGQLMQLALLELKVLRSRNSSGKSISEQKTLDWIDEGVDQAFDYRQKKNAAHSALCCFDMRAEDTGEACFGHVRTKAEKLMVDLKRWFLYSTSKKQRAAEAARAMSEGC